MDLIDDLAKNNDTVTNRIHFEVSSFVGYPVYQNIRSNGLRFNYRRFKPLSGYNGIQALENLSL